MMKAVTHVSTKVTRLIYDPIIDSGSRQLLHGDSRKFPVTPSLNPTADSDPSYAQLIFFLAGLSLLLGGMRWLVPIQISGRPSGQPNQRDDHRRGQSDAHAHSSTLSIAGCGIQPSVVHLLN